jgi:hypothetical protein
LRPATWGSCRVVAGKALPRSRIEYAHVSNKRGQHWHRARLHARPLGKAPRARAPSAGSSFGVARAPPPGPRPVGSSVPEHPSVVSLGEERLGFSVGWKKNRWRYAALAAYARYGCRDRRPPLPPAHSVSDIQHSVLVRVGGWIQRHLATLAHSTSGTFRTLRPPPWCGGGKKRAARRISCRP